MATQTATAFTFVALPSITETLPDYLRRLAGRKLSEQTRVRRDRSDARHSASASAQARSAPAA